MDEYGRFYNAAGERIADPDAQQALTVRASSDNMFFGPLGVAESFFRGVAGDLTKAVTDATRTESTFVAPADDDQEEASSKAGGLVAQSVVDYTYGLGGLTEDADWGADATGGWW